MKAVIASVIGNPSPRNPAAARDPSTTLSVVRPAFASSGAPPSPLDGETPAFLYLRTGTHNDGSEPLTNYPAGVRTIIDALGNISSGFAVDWLEAGDIPYNTQSGYGHIQTGMGHAQEGVGHSQSGYRNVQSGTNNHQSGNNNTQSSYSNTQSGMYNQQTVGYCNIQTGSHNVQTGRHGVQTGFESTQAGRYCTQSGYRNTQAGRYGIQHGRQLNDGGFNHAYMLGLLKTATVASRLYLSLDNGIWIKPRSGNPGALENGVVWYDATVHKFRGYANGVVVDFH